MYAPTGNAIDFKGVLVQRQHKPGQNYVQLVFETAEGLKLSVSRNWHMMRSLPIGQTYHVRGVEQVVGRKTFVHDPMAVPVQSGLSFAKRPSKLAIIVTSLALFVGIAGASAIALTGHRAANNNRPTAKKAAITKQPAPTIGLSSNDSSTAPTTETTATTSVTTTSTPVKKALATTNSQSTVASPSSSQSSTAVDSQTPAATTDTPITDTSPSTDTPPTDPATDPDSNSPVDPPVIDPDSTTP